VLSDAAAALLWLLAGCPQVWTVGFSPDGRRLVSGADDKKLVVYGVA
jgi:hypothetical protein